MILDYFGFEAIHPDHPLSIREADAAAVVHGSSPAVGNIEIQDKLNELIVFIGDFTHGHFDCYDESLSQEQQHKAIADDVLSFLADVFADKVEFYRAAHDDGGWRPAGIGPEPSHTWSASSKV